MAGNSDRINDQAILAQAINHATSEAACHTKAFTESILALLLLAVSMPIILVALIVIRLTSRGPAIYRQKRLGLQGRTFMIYKIRSMYVDSERRRPVWSPTGRPTSHAHRPLLRATHLDELPQLVNVVRGEMSLIGPRPERPEIAAQLERSLSGYGDRLRIRPGLSGLAQVLQGPDTALHGVQTKLGTTFTTWNTRASGSISGLPWPRCSTWCVSPARSSPASSDFRSTIVSPLTPFSRGKHRRQLACSSRLRELCCRMRRAGSFPGAPLNPLAVVHEKVLVPFEFQRGDS